MHDALRLTVSVLPTLADPLVISALWGWSDGSGSAMAAARYLRNQWGATELASIDPDRFYDLSVARPMVRRRGGTQPTVRWPGVRFHLARPPGSARDVVFIVGREPALRWQEFCALVGEFMQTVGASRFLTLGTRPVELPHTRPAPVVLGDADEAIERTLRLTSVSSQYEGPTGVQTALMLHVRSIGVSTGRLTALVPNYISGGPNPHAMIALVEQLDRAVGADTDRAPMRDAITAFDAQVLESSEDANAMQAELRRLEEQYDAQIVQSADSLPSTEDMLADVDDLLRRHREHD